MPTNDKDALIRDEAEEAKNDLLDAPEMVGSASDPAVAATETAEKTLREQQGSVYLQFQPDPAAF